MSIRSGIPWRTLGLAAVALAAAAFPGSLELFELNREAVAGGQFWRLITGHMVHGSLYHLGLDLAAWVLAGLLFEPVLGRRFWTVVAVSAVCIDAGFLFLQPDLGAYCGLSGILNGLMVAGALALWKSARVRGDSGRAILYILVLAGILGKIAVEGLGGTALFSEVDHLGAVPVPMAHALGALGAVLAINATRLPGSGNLTIYA